MNCECKGKYTFARTCGIGCPCRFKEHYTHLNLVVNGTERDLSRNTSALTPCPEVRYVNVRGRAEHEAILKDAIWCKELGLDQNYEVTVYLKRWGSWLRN